MHRISLTLLLLSIFVRASRQQITRANPVSPFYLSSSPSPPYSASIQPALVVVEGGKQVMSGSSPQRPPLRRASSHSMRNRGARRHRMSHALALHDTPSADVIFAPIEGRRILTKIQFINANSKENTDEQFKIYEHFIASRGQSMLPESDPFFVTEPPSRTTIASPTMESASDESSERATRSSLSPSLPSSPPASPSSPSTSPPLPAHVVAHLVNNSRAFPFSPIPSELAQREEANRGIERYPDGKAPQEILQLRQWKLLPSPSQQTPAPASPLLPTSPPLPVARIAPIARPPRLEQMMVGGEISPSSMSSLGSYPSEHQQFFDANVPFRLSPPLLISPPMLGFPAAVHSPFRAQFTDGALVPPPLPESPSAFSSVSGVQSGTDGIEVPKQRRNRPGGRGSYSKNRTPNRPIPLPAGIIDDDTMPNESEAGPETRGEGDQVDHERRRLVSSDGDFSLDESVSVVTKDEKPSFRLRHFLTRFPHLQPPTLPREKAVSDDKDAAASHHMAHHKRVSEPQHSAIFVNSNQIARAERLNVLDADAVDPPLQQPRQPQNANVAPGMLSQLQVPSQPTLAASATDRIGLPQPLPQPQQAVQPLPSPQFISPQGFYVPPVLTAPNQASPQMPEEVLVSTYRQQLSPNDKLGRCCQRQQVQPSCQNLCNFDGFNDKTLVTAFLTNQCPGPQLGKAFDCASSKADHNECCLRGGLGAVLGGKCLAFCSTHLATPSNVLDYLPCLQVFRTIRDCYRDYQTNNPNIFEPE